MSQTPVLLGSCLSPNKTFHCSVFSAQLLHCPELLSGGLSMRHYQGQNVTVNYTSLPPNQSLVPQGQLHCVKFLIHNLVFSGQTVEARGPKPIREHIAFHSWLTQRPKQNGAHWHFTCRTAFFKFKNIVLFLTEHDRFLKSPVYFGYSLYISCLLFMGLT